MSCVSALCCSSYGSLLLSPNQVAKTPHLHQLLLRGVVDSKDMASLGLTMDVGTVQYKDFVDDLSRGVISSSGKARSTIPIVEVLGATNLW